MIEDRRNWMAKDLAGAAGLDPSRIRQLLLAGKIRGEKVGQIWVVSNQEAKRWLRSRGIEVEAEAST
jgi:hypothetical protein